MFEEMKLKSIVKTLLVVGMLSWVAVGSAQNRVRKDSLATRAIR